MTYAELSDLQAAVAPETLVLLADDDGDGAADSVVMDAALAAASAEIDQALAGRYVTPLDPAPEVVGRWCVDLALARLYLRRREATPVEIERQAALTRRALEAIASGMTGLATAQPRPAELLADGTRWEDDAVFIGEALEEY